MKEEPSPRRAQASTAFTSLMMSAMSLRGIDLASQGLAAFEEGIERNAVDSVLVFRAFLQSDSPLVEGFVRHSTLPAEALSAALATDGHPAEVPAPLPEGSSLDRSTMTQPLKDGMTAARETATAEGRDRWRSGEALANILLHPDSSAAKALGAAGVPLADVAAWLRTQPDESMSVDSMLERMMRDNREAIYRLQPSIQREVAAQAPTRKYDDAIRRNRLERIRERPNLVARLTETPPMEKHTWLFRAMAVKDAALWEASSRRAPSVTLEHLVLALIVDGTDTSALLDGMGVDRAALRRELEEFCPTFESGPELPEESAPYSLSGADEPAPPVPFSDLHALAAILWHEEQPAVRILTRLGITNDRIQAALREKQRGRGWRTERPNLTEGLRFVGKNSFETIRGREAAIGELAQFEARKRQSPQTTADHLLLALLSPETETSAWLRSIGIDPETIAAAIDRTLAHGDSDLASPPFTVRSGIGFVLMVVPFSDLAILHRLFEWPNWEKDAETRGLRLLVEHGVTPEKVKAALPPTRGVDEVLKEELGQKDDQALE